ncbi:MAG: hypothetical protein ACO3A2_10970 [Bdellovibrionia bacterium]
MHHRVPKMHFAGSCVLGVLVFTAAQGQEGSLRTPGSGPPLSPASIAGLLKPAVFKRVVEEREVMVHAALDSLQAAQAESFRSSIPPSQEVQRYSFYASMLVHATQERVYRELTDYRLYAKLIPFVDQAVYSESSKTLALKGGIWNFKLSSTIVFEEGAGEPQGELKSRRIRFQIIRGHFQGLSGHFIFEKWGPGKTLVYLNGEKQGAHWPPRWVIERGAEVVLGFTAQRMRSHIEHQKRLDQGAIHGHSKKTVESTTERLARESSKGEAAV